MMETHLISFGGSTVTVEYSGEAARGIVEMILADVAPVLGTRQYVNASHWTIRLVSVAAAPVQSFEGVSGAALRALGQVTPEVVLGRLCYQLANRSHGGLLFHAAGLGHVGRGLLLPGMMEAGKTTLTAWLLAQGYTYTYLTDELVFVSEGSAQIQAFTRPLNLRADGLSALQAALAIDLSDLLPRDGATALVAPRRFGSGQVHNEAVLDAIIFPCFVAGSPLSFTPLSKAETGLALMECLINARNLPQHGFPEVVRLARSVPAYRLQYGSFSQLEGWFVEALMEKVM